MSFSNTTLIIGAGAHVPYDFPTGKRLLEDIISMHPEYEISDLSTKNFKHKLFKDCIENLRLYISKMAQVPYIGNSDIYESTLKKSLESFIITLGKSRSKTIDHFLKNFPPNTDGKLEDFSDESLFSIIGKVVIVTLMNSYENDYVFWQSSHDWIDDLMHDYLSTKEQAEEFFEYPLNIITFNYDNLFEKLILNRLIHFLDYERADALKLVEKLNITHVYGDIKTIQVHDNQRNRDNIIQEGINSIKVIGEERLLLETKKEINKKLNSTKYLYFLGFGFDQQNMELLFGQDLSKWNHFRAVSFTNYKMPYVDQKKLVARFSENEWLIMKDPMKELDCKSLLKEHVPLMTRDLYDKLADFFDSKNIESWMKKLFQS